jgi:hypothetical protein
VGGWYVRRGAGLLQTSTWSGGEYDDEMGRRGGGGSTSYARKEGTTSLHACPGRHPEWLADGHDAGRGLAPHRRALPRINRSTFADTTATTRGRWGRRQVYSVRFVFNLLCRESSLEIDHVSAECRTGQKDRKLVGKTEGGGGEGASAWQVIVQSASTCMMRLV